MIIELTRDDVNGSPVMVNLDMVTYMEPVLETNFTSMEDKWLTEIHFPYDKIRVQEKYEGIWNRMVQNGVEVVSELKRI